MASDFTVTQIQAASRYRFFQRPNASRISERPAKVLMRLLYTWAFTASQGCSRSWGGGSFFVHSSWIPLILSDLREDNSKHGASKINVGSAKTILFTHAESEGNRQLPMSTVSAGKTPARLPLLDSCVQKPSSLSQVAARNLRPGVQGHGRPHLRQGASLPRKYCKKKGGWAHWKTYKNYHTISISNKIIPKMFSSSRNSETSKFNQVKNYRLHIKYYRSYAGHSAWQWPPRLNRSHDPVMGKSIGSNINAMYQRCIKDISKMYQRYIYISSSRYFLSMYHDTIWYSS